MILHDHFLDPTQTFATTVMQFLSPPLRHHRRLRSHPHQLISWVSWAARMVSWALFGNHRYSIVTIVHVEGRKQYLVCGRGQQDGLLFGGIAVGIPKF